MMKGLREANKTRKEKKHKQQTTTKTKNQTATQIAKLQTTKNKKVKQQR